MAEDANANIRVDIDTAAALANIKNLQRQISTFHASLAKSGAAASASSLQLQQSLLNGINRTGQFSASIKNVKTTTESFTNALEKNKLSMREYFRYAGASTRTFGSLFRTEFDTVNKVARERVKDLQTQYIKMGRDANGAMKAIAVRPLALDMENLGTKTQIAAQRQALLNQLLKQGSTNLLNFGKNTQWAGRQLMVGFTVPLIMFGAVASKTFMDMEKQAIRFKRVYGEMFTTTEETTKALEDVKKLAGEFTKYGVAVAKTMELAADIAATGKMGADLTAQVSEATRLAVLGGVEQAEALKATISLTDAFGVSADQLAGKIDFLNAVENQTVTSIEDLTVAIPKAGPVVQQLGGDVQDLTFFLTAMREGGINASEGANALKSGLASLINPTGKASEMLEGFGINIKGIVEANKGDVKGIVIGFAKALDTLDPLNRAQAIEQLFGKFQFARLSTLFQNVIKEGNQASRVLKLTNATTEELAILSERELKRVEDSPMFKFQKALEDIKVTLVPLGEAFLKAVTPLLEFGTKVLEKFNELDEGAKGFVVGLTAIAGVIGPVFLMGFGLIANGVANIIKMFTFFKTTLNKAGTASTTLGMQTDYMTQQQLEASAVAASLNQVHQTLRQTFTSEAAAVNALTAAYERGIVKQQAFMGTAAGRGRVAKGNPKVPGYSKGIKSVPGPAGAGDVVPAMLSPQEAVIPADSAKANPGLVSQLVDNKAGKQIDIAANAPKPRAVPPKPATVMTYTNATQFLPSAANVALDTPEGAKIKDIKSFMGKSGVASSAPMAVEIADRMAGQAKGTNKSVSAPEIQKVLDDPKMAKKFKTFGNEYSKIMNQQLAQAQAKGLSTIKQDDFARMAKTASLEAAKKAGISQKIVRGILSEKTTVKETEGGRRKSMFARGQGRTFYENRAELAKQQAARMCPSGNFDASGMHMAHISPNERMTPDQIRADAKSRGFTLGTTALREIEKAEASAKATSKVTAATQKQEKAQRKATKTTKEATKATEKKTKSDTKSTKATKSKTATETKAAKAQAEAEQAAKRRAAALKGVETRRSNAAARAATAGTAAPGAKPVGRPMMGGGAIGMAASGAVMAGSMMPGDIGKMSQDLMMPVMLASMILPMLKPPVALAAVAITAVVAGALALKGAFDKAQDESLALTEAMGGGAKSIQAFSEFTGKVSAGEIMDRRRESSLSQFSVKTGKTTFGESFVQSEAGKGMVSSARQSISSVGKQTTESQLVNQLVTAVASGALDAMQARSVAANIAQELGDYSFGINVNAKLLELIGPNGENLLNNPLEVRMKLVQDTKQAIVSQQPNLTQQSNRAAVASNITGTATVMGAVAGASIGSVVPGVGTAIGGVVGGLIGAGATAFNLLDSLKGLGAATGAAVASGQIALEQQQEMVDSLDLQYERRIAEAVAAGDTAKADELTNKHLADRKTLLAENAKNTKIIVDMYKNENWMGQGAMGQAVDKAIEDRYADDPQQKALAIGARDQIVAASGLSQEQEYEMKLRLSTGDLQPQQVLNLIGTFGKDSEQLTKVLSIMTKFGAGEGNRSLQLMNLFVDKDGNADPVAQKTFIANLESKDSTGAAKYLDMFAEASKLGGANIVKTDVIMDFYNNNPGKALEFQNMMDKINAVDGKMSMDFVQNLIGDAEFEKFKENQAYFESLDPQQQKDFISAYTNTMTMEGDPDMVAAWKSWVKTLPAGEKGTAFQDFAINTAVRVTEAGADTSTAAVEPVKPTPSSGGGGRKADPLDGILKALQNVRKASINAQGGVKELFKLFEKGRNISVFKGIENQLLKLTSNTEFTSFIAGLDKQEQKLFITIKKGNVELTKRGRLLEKAYRAKAVGDFVLSQQKLVIASKNELTARRLLIKAGYSYVKAVELSRDADIAAAYASAAATKGAKARRKAIEEVTKALRLGLAAQEATKTAEEKFDELYDKIQAKLDADRNKIELKFKVDSAADDKIIRDAENKIAGIQYKLDDQEAGLSLISDKEDAINEKYDKRLEALNKIKSINDSIAQQQKNQLSLADALSSGDIGAAASAMQQIQQDFVAGSSAKQEDLIEKARQQELLNITTLINGELRTREQIEKTIKDLQKEIFDLEESKLEPALERNRLLVVARDEALLKLDIEADKWLAVKNSIELAKYAALDYAKALADANALALQAIAEINNPKPAATTTVTTEEADTKTTKTPKTPVTTPSPAPAPPPPAGNKPDYTKYSLAELKLAINQPNQAAAASRELANRAGVGSGTSADSAERRINALLDTIPKQSSQLTKAQVEAKERAEAKAKADAKAEEAARAKLAKSRAEAAQEAAMASRAPKNSFSNQKTGVVTTNKPATVPKNVPIQSIFRASGGIVPQYFTRGGKPKKNLGKNNKIGQFMKPRGTDIVPAMLTPGEFVMSREAVQSIGLRNLEMMNNLRSLEMMNKIRDNRFTKPEYSIDGQDALANPKGISQEISNSSVYNYSVNVNVATNADSNAIARTVIAQIKQVDSQRIRGVRA
jgi:hypothetical protein